MSLHAATGAAMGAAVRSPLAAGTLGPFLHLAGDRVPHRDIPSRRFEIASGVAVLTLLALRRGVLDPATVGALATAAPDVEHVIRLPRPGGSKLFHDRRGWHRSGGMAASTQLLLAGVIVGWLWHPRRQAAKPAGAW